MPNRQQIVDSIAAVAQKLGRSPARSEFISLSGISLYFVLQSFPKWNDAIRAAGLHPYSLNARIADDALLEDWGKVVRRNRSLLKYRPRLPRHIYRRQGKFSPHTLALRFGGWSSVPHAFRNFAKGSQKWADVIAVLPSPAPGSASGESGRSQASEERFGLIPQMPLQSTLRKGRPVYGNPVSFQRFRHEPLNEQGVVLLFGMLAGKLGFIIDTVQKGFPDCEAIRHVAPGRWQRVLIEFEFESRNFRDHGHPTDGCDLIVCWRHNWPDCPSHIEIVELSSMIGSLEPWNCGTAPAG